MPDNNSTFVNENDDAVHVTVRARKIVTIRYKVYLFFLGLIMFVFWPTFLTTIDDVRGEASLQFTMSDPVNGLLYNRGKGGLLNKLDSIEVEIEEVSKQIETVNLEKKVVEQLTNEGKINTLVNCINDNTNCSEVPPELLPSIGMLRKYLIINQLQGSKMDFNQKLILRNLYEFLLRTNGVLNGRLLSINFAVPKVVDNDLGLRQLQATLKIEFSHHDRLMDFLENLENKVSLELPILYIIKTINYDIVNYSQTQVVDISVDIYYYVSEDDGSEKKSSGGGSAPKEASDEELLEDLKNIGREQGEVVGTGEADLEQAANNIEEGVEPLSGNVGTEIDNGSDDVVASGASIQAGDPSVSGENIDSVVDDLIENS